MKYCIYCMEEINTDKCPHCGKVQSEHRCKEHVLPPGTLLSGRYLLGDTLGEGGFGITYIAFDTVNSEKVAVKEYFPVGMVTRSTAHSSSVTIISSDKHEDMVKKGKKDIDREAQILSAFKDEPGIVTIKNRFSLNNTVYLVTEYLGRLTLKTYLERSGRIRSDTVLCMFLPIMNSLRKVHGAGLIHRDIAPDNIMLCGEHIVLIDFGAAREYLDEKSMSVILKRGYAPFEQYHSHGKQGAWTDIYSICAVMYHCITGEKVAEPLSRQEEETLIPPSKMGIEIDPVFEKALLHGLEIRPGSRPQSIDELLSEMHIDPDEIEISDEPISVPPDKYVDDENEQSDSYVTENPTDLTPDPKKAADEIPPQPEFDDTDYDPNKHRHSEMINAAEQEEALRRAREAERNRREEEERKRQEQEKAEKERREKIKDPPNTINGSGQENPKKVFPIFVIPSVLIAIVIIALLIKSSFSSNAFQNTSKITTEAISVVKPITTATTTTTRATTTTTTTTTTTSKPTTTTTTRATTTTTSKPITTTTTTTTTTITKSTTKTKSKTAKAKTTTTKSTTKPKTTTTSTTIEEPAANVLEFPVDYGVVGVDSKGILYVSDYSIFGKDINNVLPLLTDTIGYLESGGKTYSFGDYKNAAFGLSFPNNKIDCAMLLTDIPYQQAYDLAISTYGSIGEQIDDDDKNNMCIILNYENSIVYILTKYDDSTVQRIMKLDDYYENAYGSDN